MKKEKFGNRMKGYESSTCGIKMIPRLPIIARLDGRSFSKFTRGLKRPYDERLTNLMIETTRFLVKETNANCGYTQSDEISLVWFNPDYDSQTLFDGKLFKLISTLSSLATGFFNKNLSNYIPEKSDLLPTFDCRVFNVPNVEEAVNVFLWRELDATKNSITMAASEFYSHQFLMNKNSSQKQELLFQKGINWNDYPSSFKRGTYLGWRIISNKMSLEEIEKLPPKHNLRKNPDAEIRRRILVNLDLPPLTKVKNKVDVILFGQNPIFE